MKVSDLIHKLNKLPQDAEVVHTSVNDDISYIESIFQVELVEDKVYLNYNV